MGRALAVPEAAMTEVCRVVGRDAGAEATVDAAAVDEAPAAVDDTAAVEDAPAAVDDEGELGADEAPPPLPPPLPFMVKSMHAS